MADQIYSRDFVAFVRQCAIPVTIVRSGGDQSGVRLLTVPGMGGSRAKCLEKCDYAKRAFRSKDH